MDNLIPCTLDRVAFRKKPQGKEFGGITNRMKAAEPSKVTPAQLCEHIREGRTFACGCFEPGAAGTGWGRYLGQRIFGVDIDNKLGYQLMPGDFGYLDYMEALERCEGREWKPLCLYFTFSANCGACVARYRLIVDSGRWFATLDESQEFMRELMAVFPEADQACKNPHTRLWCGSNGEVWPCFGMDWKGARWEPLAKTA